MAYRLNFIENEKPILNSSYSKENSDLKALFEKKENLKELHLKREQKLIFEIDYIKKELSKAKQKHEEYENQNIKKLISKVSNKEALTMEQKTLGDEKNLLTSKFAEISQKFEALIKQTQNQQQEFTNTQNADILKIKSDFGDHKSSIFDKYRKLITQINDENKDEIDKASNDLDNIKENENSLKGRKSELKHKTFFSTEIEKCKDDEKTLSNKISNSKNSILNAINETKTIRKEWELETKEVERHYSSSVEKENEKSKKLTLKIENIENKIQQSKSSLYGWLNDNISDWQSTIGKVIDEDNVLFNTELNPKLIDTNSSTLFGIELNLNTLRNRVKSVKEYQQEIEVYKGEIDKIQNAIQQLSTNRESGLSKLKIKFGKKLKDHNEAIAENEYAISQNEAKFKKNKIDLEEWISKAKSEKEAAIKKSENNLGEIASKKVKAEEILQNIKKGIKRKISLKEKERDKEIKALEESKSQKIAEINTSISNHKSASNKRIQELKEKQSSELEKKRSRHQKAQYN